MFAIPEVQYAEGHGGLIAYEIFGDGPVDLVHIAGWAQTVEGIWDLPMAERFYRRLASFARVVLIDRRGTGLSDPLRNVYSGGDFGPWLEEAVSDLITVLDAIGSERVAVLANRYGQPSRSPSPRPIPIEWPRSSSSTLWCGSSQRTTTLGNDSHDARAGRPHCTDRVG